MKKNFIISLVITVIINFICTIINFICAKFYDFLPLSYYLSGGEYSGYLGFGVLLEHIYPMEYIKDSTYSHISHLSFSFTNFIICFLLLFIIVFVVVYFIRKYILKK